MPVIRRQSKLAERAPIAALLLICSAAFVWARCGLAGCPDPADLVAYRPGAAPVLLDRSGATFAMLHPLGREMVALDSLRTGVADAFVAVEDRRFYRHDGVDWIRVGGALFHNLGTSEDLQGASTITMQLARSVFPDRLPLSERTMRRKLLEARVAKSIERRFSKAEILELYLNNVYLGAGINGISAATRYYFDRSAADLDLAQAALLAGMVRAPSRTDPRRWPERATARRNLVLSLMEAQGVIPDSVAVEARAQPLGIADEPPAPRSATPAPYFVEAVRAELERHLGDRAHRSGLEVHTTLNPGAQSAAEQELAEILSSVERGQLGAYRGPSFDPSEPAGAAGTNYLQGAVVVMEAESGDVLALVGGRDFEHSRFNRAIQGRRPAGSAFKPAVYLAALREGFVLSQPVDDRPFRLSADGTDEWSPENYDGEYRGLVTMREALVQSLNVPTARLALALGVGPIVQAARDIGFRNSLVATPALALGTAAVSPLELTAAYTTFAREGVRAEPRLIRRVEDERGRTLFNGEVSTEAVVDPRLAHLLTDLLREVVDRGTGNGVRRAGFAKPAAGKTGTTQDGSDAWFVGYTPRHVATVWIGFDTPRPIMRGASGGRLAAPVWGALMSEVEASGDTPSPWPRPERVVERLVHPETGLVLEAGCRFDTTRAVTELFLEEYVPEDACPPPEGFFSRLTHALRGLFRGPLGERDVQSLNGAESVDLLLGAPRLPMEAP